MHLPFSNAILQSKYTMAIWNVKGKKDAKNPNNKTLSLTESVLFFFATKKKKTTKLKKKLEKNIEKMMDRSNCLYSF